MEAQEIHRGRLIDHLQLVVRDLAASKRFYEAVLGALGGAIQASNDEFFYSDELFVSTAQSRAAQGELTGRVHLAFQAADRDAVQRAFDAGKNAGGTANGDPGERPYHPGYYAAFLTDPDGNNIEVVFHGPHQRSAPSVKITF